MSKTPTMPEARPDAEILPPRPMAELEPRDLAPAGETMGQMMMQSFNAIITAQRVPVQRDLVRFQNNLRVLASINSDQYVYSWEAKNQDGTKGAITGPTIKLANDLMREYGNCIVDMAVEDKPEHWVFHARFTDLETGASMVRLFQQRKGQRAGKRMDAERALDIAFQIGQSKAIRNVVCNFLQTFSNFMLEEAERGTLKKIADNQPKAWEFVERAIEHYGLSWSQVEASIGRRAGDWSVKDLARAYMQFKGVAEGLTDIADLYPDKDTAGQITARQDRERAAHKEAGRQHNEADLKAKQDAEAKAKAAEESKPQDNAAETKPEPQAQEQGKVQPEATQQAATAQPEQASNQDQNDAKAALAAIGGTPEPEPVVEVTTDTQAAETQTEAKPEPAADTKAAAEPEPKTGGRIRRGAKRASGPTMFTE